jgi:two-component system sensor histidine kinase BaeS
MALLAVCLLVVGTVVASRFIFGPAHRRLKQLETTVQMLGAGEVNARAEENGGDEVASLARTFNAMASDLSTRAAQIVAFDRTRRLLLADVSHELMTPLTAIRGYQEQLASDPLIKESPRRAHYVAIIGEEALRVERIVRELLDLARFEGGGDILDIQDVSIEGLFGRVAARQAAEVAARDAHLSTTIDVGAEIIRCDQFRLEQALQNLAANALRYVPAGGTVKLHAGLDGKEIVITVRNTGAGIPAEHLPFILDRFYKVDSARTAKSEGSGLGLSIVRAIVERHGGVVSVASQPGVETVFTLRLPAGTDAVAFDRAV